MAVSTLLRRVGRLLTNPSEGDQLVFIGKGDRKPPKQVDMGNSGQSVRNVYGITEVGSWTAGALDASVPPTDGFIGPGWGAKIAVMPEEAGESGLQGFEPHTSDFSGPSPAVCSANQRPRVNPSPGGPGGEARSS